MPNIYVMKSWLHLCTRNWARSEASHAQHLRDEELATSLHQELGQIRSETVQIFSNYEQQTQGEGQQMAQEYQRLVDELNKEARENLQPRMEASQNLSAVVIMKERMGLMKSEESAVHEEADRQCLRQQEELQAHSQQAWRQELEAARRQAHQVSQQSSSMPLSSKTSEAGT